MAEINPYEPPGLNQDRKRFGVPAWLKSLLLYSLAFNVSTELVSGGPSSLLSWFYLSQVDFAYRAFVGAVLAVPVFFVGYLVIRSKSKTETICRASLAGTVFALSPGDLIQLNRFVDWLSLQGLRVFRLLRQETNQWAFNLLFALLIEVLAVVAWRTFWRRKTTNRR